MKKDLKNIKRTFWKKGACSHALFYILNLEFDHLKENEERAADPLAGGIMQQGYQCGMLWGAALAIGAESYRRYDNSSQATGKAITTTQHVVSSFCNRTKSMDCMDITKCDWSSKKSMAKYFFTGKFLSCFKLMEKWVPEAIQAVNDGFAAEDVDVPDKPVSCASYALQKMGASDEEMVMVAGLAGGLGLSGNACGALAAVIWKNTLSWNKEHFEKVAMSNPKAQNVLDKFLKANNYEILCSKISGQTFNSVDEHTRFINNGGCEKVIGLLTEI